MSKRNDRLSLNDMRNHAREAIALLDGANRQDFSENRVLQLALARLIEIIGEAAYRLLPETREQHPNIPWDQIMGMRNRIAHGYDLLDINVLYDTVTLDLENLVTMLDDVLHGN